MHHDQHIPLSIMVLKALIPLYPLCICSDNSENKLLQSMVIWLFRNKTRYKL